MKKHQVLTIALSAVTLVLLAGSASMLGSSLSKTGGVAARRDGKFAELEGIYRAPVFPERKNIELIRRQAEEVAAWTSNVLAAQRAVIPADANLTPSQFMQVLQPTVRELARLKTAGGTQVVPDGFAFGFDAYITGGQMPAAEDIPKLALQLEITKRLCREICAANVGALQSVTRFAFEARRRICGKLRRSPQRRAREPSAGRGRPSRGRTGDPRALVASIRSPSSSRAQGALLAVLTVGRHRLFVMSTRSRWQERPRRQTARRNADLKEAPHPQRWCRARVRPLLASA